MKEWAGPEDRTYDRMYISFSFSGNMVRSPSYGRSSCDGACEIIFIYLLFNLVIKIMYFVVKALLVLYVLLY